MTSARTLLGIVPLWAGALVLFPARPAQATEEVNLKLYYAGAQQHLDEAGALQKRLKDALLDLRSDGLTETEVEGLKVRYDEAEIALKESLEDLRKYRATLRKLANAYKFDTAFDIRDRRLKGQAEPSAKQESLSRAALDLDRRTSELAVALADISRFVYDSRASCGKLLLGHQARFKTLEEARRKRGRLAFTAASVGIGTLAFLLAGWALRRSHQTPIPGA